MNLKVGDKVRKNPATWVPSDFDGWGRGEGIGEVVDLGGVDYADVRWPKGRCWELIVGLELVDEGIV